MRYGSLIAGLFIGIVFGSRSSEAQYTADFQTNIISGVTSNWIGNGTYVVGSNTFLDALFIQSGAVLANDHGYIGFETGGSNNVAAVSGTGSVWSNRLDLYVGYSGGGNRLVVSNGGAVVRYGSGDGYLGRNISSSNNVAVVTGPGSVWSNRLDLYVGYSGGGNQLVVSNGGAVASYGLGDGYLGRTILSSNNVVVVTGTGSVWSKPQNLYVGYGSGGNKLVVTNGGMVVSSLSFVGRSSGYNMVLVTGPGSVWSNAAVIIGDGGAGNQLEVSDGGAVSSDGGTVGSFSSSSNNVVVVTGTGSVWSNRLDLYVGYSGGGNQLVVSNGGAVFNSTCYVGNGISSSNNVALVTGTGSVWTNSSELYVGAYGGTGNSLTISNQGAVFNNTCYVGYIGTASNNSVRVVDGGAWQNFVLHVGESGSGNSLAVDGGTVFATNLIIGVASSLCDNLVRLDSGTVIVTNASTNAVLEVRRGTLVLNGGTLQVDRFVMTNACAQFVRTGGTLIYGATVLDPNRDDDGDGIPNSWEQANGLDPLNAADANVDGDGDGFTNLQEYLAGTGPTNSASAFRIIGITPEGDDMRITWTTVGGKKYAMQAVAGDYTNNFVEFEPVIIAPGTGESTFSVIHLGGATDVPGRFYRVRLVP